MDTIRIPRQKVRLEDLKDGDVVYVDNGFTCMNEGARYVRRDKDNGKLFLYCAGHGESGTNHKHLLDGQVGDDGFLVGIER